MAANQPIYLILKNITAVGNLTRGTNTSRRMAVAPKKCAAPTMAGKAFTWLLSVNDANTDTGRTAVVMYMAADMYLESSRPFTLTFLVRKASIRETIWRIILLI